MNTWQRIWNTPTYQEWAYPQSYGYALTIIRKQPKKFLVAQAKLILEEFGLPGFEITDSQVVSTPTQVKAVIKKWQAAIRD